MKSRATLLLLGLLVSSCRDRGATMAEPVYHEATAPHVGAFVFADAFQFATCDLEAIAFPSRTHGYVRDACGNVYGTTDGGASFVEVDFLNRGWPDLAPLPLIGDHPPDEWVPFPGLVRVNGAVISIHQDRRLLIVATAQTPPELVAIKRKGSRKEQIVRIVQGKLGLIAWTQHTVLGADGPGPLVARMRVPHDEIEQAVRPFAREWLVRTRTGALVRSRKRGWIKSNEDPFEAVASDDLDRWLFERSIGGDRLASRIQHAFASRMSIDVSLAHESCSDSHAPVDYSVRGDPRALWLSRDGGVPRRLSSADQEQLSAGVTAAFELSAVPQRWSFGSQSMTVAIRIEDQPTLIGRYTYPSPLTEALLAALSE